MKFSRFLVLSVAVAAFSMVSGAPMDAFAKTTHKTSKTTSSSKKHHKKKKTASVVKHGEAVYSALVVNAETGQVLYEKNASSIRYPASLTKMMTLYLAFDAIKHNKLGLHDKLDVSQKAHQQPQTNISLEVGDRLPVETAIESVVVRSANDSAMVLAEAVGGTEWNFAMMMNKKARELGMKDTVFRNPSGLPDNQQHTSAYDMARLAIALRRDFPEYYHYFKMNSFVWNGITYPGHNHVMAKYPGVDGVKTGYIRASGYNLVTPSNKDGHRLVAVVMGGSTITSRDDQMMALLDRSFASLEHATKNVASNENDTNPSTPTVEARNIYPTAAFASAVH